MEQFVYTETLVIVLLLVVSLVAIAVRRLRIPYMVALVIVGLLITFQQPLQINLTPELILALFIPPLVFEAAFQLDVAELQRNLAGILMLAVPGVIVTMLIVGGMVAWGTGLNLQVALVFGALIAATDPTAVVALFRSLGVPKRLGVLIEGESLFNDGTAIVLFGMVLTTALTHQFDLGKGLIDFMRVAAGGTIIGLVLGFLVSRAIASVDDYLIETTLTTVLAFGSYLIAERLQFSGVLAVVGAGIVNGNLGPKGMSPTTRIVLTNFWEYVAFLANSLLFLLIGLQINVVALAATWQPVFWAIAAVLVARAVIVYALGWLASLLSEPIPRRWQPILFAGGLRGAISIALVLSLPAALGPDRDLLRLMGFGVVLFTLLVQGTTMGPLLRRLRIVVRSETQIEYEMSHARLTALRASQSHLERLHREGLVSADAWEALSPELSERDAVLSGAVREVLSTNPELETKSLDTARREILRAQRSTMLDLRRDGVISDEAFEKLVAEVDARLTNTGTAVPVESTPLPSPAPEE